MRRFTFLVVILSLMIFIDPESSVAQYDSPYDGFAADLNWDDRSDLLLFHYDQMKAWGARVDASGRVWKSGQLEWGENGGGLPLTGDFDGDGRTDVAVWKPSDGTWLATEINGQVIFEDVRLGKRGDTPFVGDFDGDGRDDLAVWRSNSRRWFAKTVEGQYIAKSHLGVEGASPLVGDFDGDGIEDILLHKSSEASWYARSGEGPLLFEDVEWGRPHIGDIPLTGDFNGDGQSEIALFRRKGGNWWVRDPVGRVMIRRVSWGRDGDRPIVGDFDGNGKDDIGFFRPADGSWHAKDPWTGEVIFQGIRFGPHAEPEKSVIARNRSGEIRLLEFRVEEQQESSGDEPFLRAYRFWGRLGEGNDARLHGLSTRFLPSKEDWAFTGVRRSMGGSGVFAFSDIQPFEIFGILFLPLEMDSSSRSELIDLVRCVGQEARNSLRTNLGYARRNYGDMSRQNRENILRSTGDALRGFTSDVDDQVTDCASDHLTGLDDDHDVLHPAFVVWINAPGFEENEASSLLGNGGLYSVIDSGDSDVILYDSSAGPLEIANPAGEARYELRTRVELQ